MWNKELTQKWVLDSLLSNCIFVFLHITSKSRSTPGAKVGVISMCTTGISIEKSLGKTETFERSSVQVIRSVRAVATLCTSALRMNSVISWRETSKQLEFSFHILPAVSTYLEKCSLSVCPSASDTDGSGHGGWGQEASLHAEKTNAISKNIQLQCTDWNAVVWHS